MPHGVTTPPTVPPCRRCRHRGDDPVKVATNATIFVFIESDGVIVIFSAGQHTAAAQAIESLHTRAQRRAERRLRAQTRTARVNAPTWPAPAHTRHPAAGQ